MVLYGCTGPLSALSLPCCFASLRAKTVIMPDSFTFRIAPPAAPTHRHPARLVQRHRRYVRRRPGQLGHHATKNTTLGGLPMNNAIIPGAIRLKEWPGRRHDARRRRGRLSPCPAAALCAPTTWALPSTTLQHLSRSAAYWQQVSREEASSRGQLYPTIRRGSSRASRLRRPNAPPSPRPCRPLLTSHPLLP